MGMEMSSDFLVIGRRETSSKSLLDFFSVAYSVDVFLFIEKLKIISFSTSIFKKKNCL